VKRQFPPPSGNDAAFYGMMSQTRRASVAARIAGQMEESKDEG
jgi:hypothetical protein